MELWRTVWRGGVVKHLTDPALRALKFGLATDDRRILQGATTEPRPINHTREQECLQACPLAYGLWIGEDLQTVGDVEEEFARLCYEADKSFGESGGIRHVLNWIDEAERSVMRKELLEEVDMELERRERRDQGEHRLESDTA